MHRLNPLVLLAISMLSPAVAAAAQVDEARILGHWDRYAEDIGMGDPPTWNYLGGGYAFRIGTVRTAYWTRAWRDGAFAGAFLRYDYGVPISPAELPGPGPMQFEEVEATFNCPARTVTIHKSYLYRPDQSYIGSWSDNRPFVPFGAGSVMAHAYARVC